MITTFNFLGGFDVDYYFKTGGNHSIRGEMKLSKRGVRKDVRKCLHSNRVASTWNKVKK